MDMSAFEIVPAATTSGSAAPGGAGSTQDATAMKLKVAWTKDQVQKAPDFQYYKPPSNTATSGGGSTTGIGGAQRSGRPQP
jgi:hypothetical protein